MALAPVPPPTFQPPAARSFYANQSSAQFTPFASARYGLGGAQATEQDLAQRVFQQTQSTQYHPPQAQGGASPSNLQQRQFGAQ